MRFVAGIPVGAIFFTETLLFTGSSLLMGYFGKVALAAHGIVSCGSISR